MSMGVASPGVPPALHGLVGVAKTAGAQGYQVGHHYRVRPDGYIALSAPGDDASATFDRLQQLMPV